jgi:WD40 repeat protein
MRNSIYSLLLIFLTIIPLGCGGASPVKVRSISGHEASVTAMVFSPDGRWLASGNEQGTFKLWDAATFTQAGSEPGDDESEVVSVSFSSDSSCLLVNRMHQFEIWQVAPLQRLNTVAAPPDTSGMLTVSMLAGCLTNDNQKLLFAIPGGLRLWNIKEGKPIVDWQITGRAFSIAIAPDNTWAAVGTITSLNMPTSLDIIDLKNGSIPQKMVGHNEINRALKISPDGKMLWSSGSDGHIWGMETSTWTIQKDLKIVGDHTAAVLAANSDRYAYFYDQIGLMSNNREMGFGDLSGASLYRINDGKLAPYSPIALSPDGRTLATAARRSDGVGVIDFWQRP